MDRLFLIHYGEIGLKGENREFFERKLQAGLQRAVASWPGASVERRHGRLYVMNTPDPEQALSRLQRVFGVVAVSPAVRAPLDLEQIRAAARQLVSEAAAAAATGATAHATAEGTVRPLTFKVKARRTNKGFQPDSMGLQRLLGADLLASVPGLKVDVHEPALTLQVEIRENAYLYCRSVPGPGGLPLGSSGKALLLLSGGIDSPVAGWMAMRRGLEVECVHFYTPPFTGPRSVEKVEDLCRQLAAWCGRIRLHLARFTEVQQAIWEQVPEDLRVLVMRRFMMRVAGLLARQQEASALVTGENLGQVASQTVESLTVIEAASPLIVLRPLLAWDKAEIVRKAQDIGTYEISIRPYEDCCTLFVPRHPRTRPTLSELEDAEASLPVDTLVQGCLEKVESSVLKPPEWI